MNENYLLAGDSSAPLPAGEHPAEERARGAENGMTSVEVLRMMERLLQEHMQTDKLMETLAARLEEMEAEMELTQQAGEQMAALCRTMRRLPQELSDRVERSVDQVMERSGFVPHRLPTAEEMLPLAERLLSPWLTRSDRRQSLLADHLKPLLGRDRLWVEEGRLNVGFNYLQKFVNALFACMDDYHLTRFRQDDAYVASELRRFLERVLVYRRGERQQTLHVMVPIRRARLRLQRGWTQIGP